MTTHTWAMKCPKPKRSTDQNGGTRRYCLARPFAAATILAVACALLPGNTAQAFTVGSSYDLLFNAFVETDNGGQGLEGHSSRMLMMDGDPDYLPLTSAVPSDITGNTLVTMEQLYSENILMHNRASISIVAENAGRLVENPLMDDSFGLVTIVMSRILWQDGTTGVGELLDPHVLLHEGDETRMSSAPIYVTGTGDSDDPWRLITSIPGDEFGEMTDRVEIVFDTVPEPSTAGLMLAGLMLCIVGLRRRQ